MDAWRLKTVPILLLALFACSLGLHPEVISRLHLQWTTAGEIDYGYFVLAAAGALLVTQTQLSVERRTIVLCLVIVAVGASFAASIAKLISFNAAFLLAMIATWTLLVLASCGVRNLRLVLSVALLFLLATPVPFLLVPYLREMTVAVVSALTKAVGIAAFIEGNLIHLPTGIIEIADGCAGEKYLRSSIILAAIALGLGITRFGFFTTLAAFSCGSLVANWIRVFFLVVFADNTSSTHPLILEHDWLGWLIYLPIVGAMIAWLVSAGRTSLVDPERTPDRGPAGPRSAVAIAMLSGLVLTLPAALPALAVRAAPPLQAIESLDGIHGCTQVAGPPVGFVPSFRSPDVELMETVRCGSGNALVLRQSAAYSQPKSGRDISSWENAPVDEDQWRRLTSAPLDLGEGNSAEAVVVASRSGIDRYLLVHWYEAGGTATGSKVVFKLALLRGFITGSPPPTAVRLAAPCADSCDAERSLLIDLATAIL
ncbi:MAG: exosortase-associated EpsI family protein [Pseudomonadota bacterium]